MHARSQSRSARLWRLAAPFAVVWGLAACGDDGTSDLTTSSTVDRTAGSSDTSGAIDTTEDEEPQIVEVVATPGADGTYRFDVTISSPYDRPEKYADAWRVVGPDGTVLGTRELTHPHADEQPFTRSLSGVEIPDDVTSVTVEVRDLVDGWSEDSLKVDLER